MGWKEGDNREDSEIQKPPLIYMYKIFSKNCGGLRDGYGVERPHCSFRGPGFGS